MTGDCDDRDGKGYEVYREIARHGNGQVFHTETDGIEQVLLALRITMKDSYTPNKNGVDFIPGTSCMPFFVDDTMTDIDIRLCGEGAKMTIKNPLNQTVTGDDLTLENLKIVSFKSPMSGRWTIEAKSSSEYTIQIGSNSDLKIEYGFSSAISINHRKTSIQPLKGSKNILTFFIADPTKIDYLSAATLIFKNNNKASRLRREIIFKDETQFKLTKISDHIYATEMFDAPIGIFKVQLYGVDLNGNQVERLVSKAIEAIEPSKLSEMN